jgi:hypothetical protein
VVAGRWHGHAVRAGRGAAWALGDWFGSVRQIIIEKTTRGPPCSMVVGADRSWHPSNLSCTLETIPTQHSPGSRGQTAPALRCTPQMLPGARRRSAPSPVPLLKGKRSEGGTPKSSRARTAVETESDALCWTVNLPIATRNTSSLFPGGENPRCCDWWLDGRWLAWLWRQAA